MRCSRDSAWVKPQAQQASCAADLDTTLSNQTHVNAALRAVCRVAATRTALVVGSLTPCIQTTAASVASQCYPLDSTARPPFKRNVNYWHVFSLTFCEFPPLSKSKQCGHPKGEWGNVICAGTGGDSDGAGGAERLRGNARETGGGEWGERHGPEQ